MKQLMTHSASDLTVGGRIAGKQLNIGTGSGNSMSILFDNGSGNKPGFRFTRSGSAVLFEYSTDGANWQEAGASSLSFEPVPFTAADLNAGKLRIVHNSGKKYVLGFGSTLLPKSVEYTDTGSLLVDFSNYENPAGAIWFAGSTPSMKSGPEEK